MHLQIQEIKENELEAVQRLSQEIWPICYREIITQAQIKYMLETMYSIAALEQAMQAGQRFLLARLDETPVGYAGFEPNHQSNMQCKLNKLYVLPHLHGTGIGKALFENVIFHAKLHHCTSLFLQVNKKNTAIYFYEKAGMYVREEAVFDIGNGFVMDDFIMQLDW